MIPPADLVDIVREGLLLALIVSAPILGAALLAGVVNMLLQMFTKVSEPATGHVVRTVLIAAALLITSPWIAAKVVSFADRVWSLTQISPL